MLWANENIARQHIERDAVTAVWAKENHLEIPNITQIYFEDYFVNHIIYVGHIKGEAWTFTKQQSRV